MLTSSNCLQPYIVAQVTVQHTYIYTMVPVRSKSHKAIRKIVEHQTLFEQLRTDLFSNTDDVLYAAFVDRIWHHIIRSSDGFNRIYGNIANIFHMMVSGINHKYTLVKGMVQSGKTSAMYMIAWYSAFKAYTDTPIKRRFRPIVFTTNLDVCKNDFLQKINSTNHNPFTDLIGNAVEVVFSANQAIIRSRLHGSRKHLTSDELIRALIQLFTLRSCDATHRSFVFDTVLGQIDIFLGNTHQAAGFVDKLCTKLTESSPIPVILIDEIHQWKSMTYTKISERHRELYMLCKENRIHLIGITATPWKLMVDTDEPIDLEVHIDPPDDYRELNSHDIKPVLCQVECNEWGMNYTKTALDMELTTPPTATPYIRMGLVNVPLNANQEVIQQWVLNKYEQQVHVVVFNQHTKEKTLSKLLDNVPRDVFTRNKVVNVVSDKSVKESISIRTSGNGLMMHGKTLFGLTFQVTSPSLYDICPNEFDHVIQAMRCMGRYPSNFPQVRVYVPVGQTLYDEYIMHGNLYNHKLLQYHHTNSYLIRNNGHATFTSDAQLPYVKSTRVHFTVGGHIDHDSIELETCTIPLTDLCVPVELHKLRLCDMDDSKQRTIRSIVKNCYNNLRLNRKHHRPRGYPRLDTGLYGVWSKQRHVHVRLAAIGRGKLGESDTSEQILEHHTEAYITGDENYLTRISDAYMVVFKQSCDQRAMFKDRHVHWREGRHTIVYHPNTVYEYCK